MTHPFEHTYGFQLELVWRGTMQASSKLQFMRTTNRLVADALQDFEGSICGHVEIATARCYVEMVKPPKTVPTPAATPQWPPAMDMMP